MLTTNIISHWFSRKRGVAMGLMLLGLPFLWLSIPSLSVAYRASWVASGLVLAGRFDLAFNVAANFDLAT